MALGMEVGFSPGDCVLDGHPDSRKKGRNPLPNFWPVSVVAKRLAAYGTWHGGRPQPRGLC